MSTRSSAAWPRRLGATATLVLAILAAPPARAQSPGEAVHVETDAGPIDGVLVDRLPDAYLLRVDGASRIVPYTSVRSIVRGAAPVLQPPAAGPLPAPYVLPPFPEPRPAMKGEPGAPLPPYMVRPQPPLNAYTIASRWLFGVGLVGAVSGGLVAALGASVLKPSPENQCTDATQPSVTYPCDYRHYSRMVTGGVATLIGSGVLMVGAIPLSVVGADKARRAQTQGATLTILASPGGATLQWSF